MTFRNGIKSCLIVVIVVFMVSCAWMSTYISEPGVEIERIATQSGRIVSAHFWQDGQQINLRGEIVPQPISKGPLGGHVHAAIIGAHGEELGCKTTHPRLLPRHVRKRYSIAFDTIPDAAKLIQVYHHFSTAHDSCITG